VGTVPAAAASAMFVTRMAAWWNAAHPDGTPVALDVETVSKIPPHMLDGLADAIRMDVAFLQSCLRPAQAAS
jgi:hypothetical protein